MKSSDLEKDVKKMAVKCQKDCNVILFPDKKDQIKRKNLKSKIWNSNFRGKLLTILKKLYMIPTYVSSPGTVEGDGR